MDFFPNGMIRYVFHDTYMPAVFLLYRILIWPEKKTTLISQPQAFFQATQILLYYQVINKIKTFSFIVSLSGTMDYVKLSINFKSMCWFHGPSVNLLDYFHFASVVVSSAWFHWAGDPCQLMRLSWGGEWMNYWTELRMFTS